MPRKPKKYHFIYKTTNLVNNKFYVGMHSTDDLEDGYFGSGKRIHYSVNKHGLENHQVEILEFLSSREELKRREAEVVNEELLANPLCMNLKFGGEGGWDHVNSSKDEIEKRCWQWVEAHSSKIKNDQEYRERYHQSMSASLKRRMENGEKLFGGKQGLGFLGKFHSEETKQKMRKTKNAGESNSQFGSRWIHNLEMKISKKIAKGEVLPEGWNEGRKMKF